VLKNIDKKPWETVLFYISLIIYIIMVAFAVIWNAVWPATGQPMHFPKADWTSLVNSTLIPHQCAVPHA